MGTRGRKPPLRAGKHTLQLTTCRECERDTSIELMSGFVTLSVLQDEVKLSRDSEGASDSVHRRSRWTFQFATETGPLSVGFGGDEGFFGL